MKAVLLCAGLGTRLEPISRRIPKPCMPVLNIPLLHLNLLYLKEAGVTEVFINLHYLPDKIQHAVNARPSFLQDLSISFSDETEELLGSGGALKNLEQELSSEQDFVVMNADIVCDLPLNKAILKRRELKSSALLVTMPHPELGKRYHPMYYSTADSRLRHVRPNLPRTVSEGMEATHFVGVQVLTPKIFEYLPPAIPSDIMEYAYTRMLAANESVHVLPCKGNWFDIGSPESFLQTQISMLKLLANHDYGDMLRGLVHRLSSAREEVDNIWIGDQVTIPDDCTLIPPVVIGNGVDIGHEVTVGPYTVIADGVRLSNRAVVERSVILPGTNQIPSERYVNAVIFGHNVIDVRATGERSPKESGHA
jgi:mannose-1-phosphate guanylyltransferase